MTPVLPPFPISRYLNVHQSYAPAPAADGRSLAFVSDITGVPQLWQVQLPAAGHPPAWPDLRTSAEDRVQRAWASPLPGDGRLILARDVGGDENTQLYLLTPDGRETSLTAGYEGFINDLSEWSADGQTLLFASNRRDPALFDLWLQPLSGGPARLAWQNDTPGYLVGCTLSPGGRRVALCRMGSGFCHDLFEVDLDTATARRLNPAGEEARYESLCYTADGRALLVNTDLREDFLYVARLDLATLGWEPLVRHSWDVEYLTRSPDARTLAYVVNVDGASELRCFDLGTGQERAAPAFSPAAGVVASTDGYLSFFRDSTRLAFSFTSATRTSDIYVWNLADDTVQAVTRSAHGGLPVESFAAPRLVCYPSFDGRQIPAWYYEPAEGGPPAPTIVYVHGGPESQFQPYFHFFLQYFVQHGYAVFAPNVRGSTGYGKAFSHLDDVDKRLDSVADLSYAAYWLQAQPGIDPGRLIVYGGSYGGFMVLAALTMAPHLWAAGVDIVGISNLVTFLENTSSYRRPHREAEYGSLEHDRELLQRISPIHHVHQVAAPLFIIHGANDPRVPLCEAEQMAAALRERRVPVELMVFPDEGHGLVKRKNKEVAYPAVVAFLEAHPEPAPGERPAEEPQGKEQLLTQIRWTREALEATLALVPPARLVEPLAGGWSVKDILAHLAAWEGRMVGWVQAAQRGEVPQMLPAGMTWDDLDRWNEQTCQENRGRPLAEVLETFRRSYQETLAVVEAVPEADLLDPARFPWREGKALWTMVAANTCGHYAEHTRQIRDWLRRG